jgi:hypothetical protein
MYMAEDKAKSISRSWSFPLPLNHGTAMVMNLAHIILQRIKYPGSPQFNIFYSYLSKRNLPFLSIDFAM